MIRKYLPGTIYSMNNRKIIQMAIGSLGITNNVATDLAKVGISAIMSAIVGFAVGSVVTYAAVPIYLVYTKNAAVCCIPGPEKRIMLRRFFPGHHSVIIV